jgi:tetratricopeptide (TPR) repeat protein
MQGDSFAARQQFEQSLSILETLSDKEIPDLARRKAKDLRNLGIVADSPSHALEYYLQSLKVSEDAKYVNGIYGASFQIASLYNGQGEYELARQFLRRGEGVTDDSQLPAEMMGILGDSYMGEGRYDKAIEAYLKQNEDVMKHEGGDNVVDSLMHLGNFYLIVQDLEKADVYFTRALQIASESKNDLKISRALEGLSRSRLAAKDLKGAIDLAEQAKAHQAKLTGVRESWEL